MHIFGLVKYTVSVTTIQLHTKAATDSKGIGMTVLQ